MQRDLHVFIKRLTFLNHIRKSCHIFHKKILPFTATHYFVGVLSNECDYCLPPKKMREVFFLQIDHNKTKIQLVFFMKN